jgi:23S rRNA pseudouridine1911/1915/1917 synthase
MLEPHLIPTILFEDADVLVINKPPGLVVNRAHTVADATLQDWLAAELPSRPAAAEWSSLVPADFSGEFGQPEAIMTERLGIAHRLDKDTSGALLIGKNPGALVHLLAQFKQRRIKKTYRCLTHGKFQINHDTLNLPLGRSLHTQLKFAVRPDGRVATTEYQVEQYFPGLDLAKVKTAPDFSGANLTKKARIYQGFSLVTCWPHTGRTHQIRVHMAHIQHPLVGDQTYAGRKRQAADILWCPRHFLHAAQLEFTHPRSGEVVTVTAPLWPDLQTALTWLLPAE